MQQPFQVVRVLHMPSHLRGPRPQQRLHGVEQGRFDEWFVRAGIQGTVVADHAREQQLTSAWGEPPAGNENSAAWVERVTWPRIDTDPRVTEAGAQQEATANAVRKTLESDDLPRLRIYAHIFGTDAVVKNRAEIEALRALTPAEAVERIEQTRAAEQAAREAAEHAVAEGRRQLHSEPHTRDSSPHHDGPALGR